MRALIQANQSAKAPEMTMNIDLISKQYSDWFNFDPFDYDTASNLSIKNAKIAIQASYKAK